VELASIDRSLVSAVDPRSPAAEAYSALRTSVQFAALDRPLRSLLVTSAAQDDDKSAVAANLAISFAMGGSRVVLVDADLRHPRQHALFGLDGSRGLTSALLGDGHGEVPLLETNVTNLRLLPTGPQPANPVDVLGSQRFADLLGHLQASADIVILDAPPALAVADAALIARRVDGVLLAYRASRTKRDHAAKAQALLAKVGANLLGAVLTNAKLDAGLRRYFG